MCRIPVTVGFIPNKRNNAVAVAKLKQSQCKKKENFRGLEVRAGKISQVFYIPQHLSLSKILQIVSIFFRETSGSHSI